jgi:hypothetical protein
MVSLNPPCAPTSRIMSEGDPGASDDAGANRREITLTDQTGGRTAGLDAGGLSSDPASSKVMATMNIH